MEGEAESAAEFDGVEGAASAEGVDEAAEVGEGGAGWGEVGGWSSVVHWWRASATTAQS